MNKLVLALSVMLAAPALAHNGVVHEAPHGGILRATKSNHYELVLAPKGGVRIYVMDGSGRPLPASAASDLSVEIDRPGQKTEYVKMAPDKSGTLWTGDSKPVVDPKSIVRVGSVIKGESSLIEVPRAQFPIYEAEGKAHHHAH